MYNTLSQNDTSTGHLNSIDHSLQPMKIRQNARSHQYRQRPTSTQGIVTDDLMEYCDLESGLTTKQVNANTPNRRKTTSLTEYKRPELSYETNFHEEFSESASSKNNKTKACTWGSESKLFYSNQRSTEGYSGASNPCSRRQVQDNDVKQARHSDFESENGRGVDSSLIITVPWPDIRKQVCNSIAKWCLMCDDAEHTVTIMKQTFPNLFSDQNQLNRWRQRRVQLSQPDDQSQQSHEEIRVNTPSTELKLTEFELTLELIDFFKQMEAITPCEYQECCIYALILVEQSFSQSLFIHTQTVERICAIMYGFAYKSLCEIDREGLNVKLSALTQLSSKEFNSTESMIFLAFDCNVNVSEEYFSNKIAALEKMVVADMAAEVLCSASVKSSSSATVYNAGDLEVISSEKAGSVQENSNSQGQSLIGKNGGENKLIQSKKERMCHQTEKMAFPDKTCEDVEQSNSACEARTSDCKMSEAGVRTVSQNSMVQSTQSESIGQQRELEGADRYEGNEAITQGPADSTNNGESSSQEK